MPLSQPAFAALAFLIAGGLSVGAAQGIAVIVEDRSAESVREELAAQGFDWATVLADGLQVVLEGEAPTEAARFEALSAAARAVDGARVIDDMHVAPSEPIAAPDFVLGGGDMHVVDHPRPSRLPTSCSRS